ncbi:Ig-like domain-containing protein [Streptomyces scopuliridis]|uniref:Ig-like domain-containing protein n=1 Tax=Streptomyces scopuliridis TaxID=452529 RepID=A0ACD4ZDX1_9ACTN|nr:Ig-like domain-containing protein [Streptomyces scopuliridis]WSB96554.1 Ig-like domain-containing protein [Streptomyces scopuliridis]WSC09742.1 Ig-like domain-containing protein [Streptomyces scopuliridis]
MTRLARARSLPALLLCCALLMGAAATVLGAAATASAADRLGDLTLGRTTGSIMDNPLVPRVTTDTACPEGQGGAVRLNVLHPKDSTPIRVGNATTGPYDAGPIDTEMPENFRTLFDALTEWYPDGAHDGTYELRLDCVNVLDPNTPPAFFTTNIVVTGDTWTLAAAETTSVELTAAPENHPAQGSEVTVTVKVTPEAAAGEVTLTSERVGTEPVVLGTKAAENGTAVFTTTALPKGVQNIRAQFTPTDPDAYAGSSNAVNGYTVDEPGTPPGGSPTPSDSEQPTGEPGVPADLDVVDADGNPLEANPILEAGQRVTITARGYAKDATVKVTLAESDATFEDATADAAGIVQDYPFTVPAELADGDHVLTLAEDTEGGHSLAFAFTTGEVTEPTPEPSDSTGADGGAAAGTSGGDTGGDTGGDSGAAGGSGGGSGGGGSLASTGTGVASIALASLALCFVGAAFVVGARRGGLLTFATPSGTAGD